jgi:Holliday junction resolvase RusA-like endonuclease
VTQGTLSIEEVQAMAKAKRRAWKSKAQWLARFAATPPMPTQIDTERHEQRALFERHDEVALTIRLPLAPTLNTYRAIFQAKDRNGKAVGRPRLITSAEGRAYTKAVAASWQNHWKGWPPEPLTGRLRLLVVVHFARKGGDIANREKALSDSLTACKAWIDDGQIDDLRFLRGSVIPGTGAMDVTIEIIPE